MEKALLYHGKKFPPMLPRILRVTRAKSVRKSEIHNHKTQRKDRAASNATAIDKPKLPSEVQSLLGRAGKLFGRARAAQLRGAENNSIPLSMTSNSTVFEGHRASSFRIEGKRKSGEVLGRGKGKGNGNGKGKPKTRSTKRAAAFKASGGKKKN